MKYRIGIVKVKKEYYWRL